MLARYNAGCEYSIDCNIITCSSSCKDPIASMHFLTAFVGSSINNLKQVKRWHFYVKFLNIRTAFIPESVYINREVQIVAVVMLMEALPAVWCRPDWKVCRRATKCILQGFVSGHKQRLIQLKHLPRAEYILPFLHLFFFPAILSQHFAHNHTIFLL